MKYPKNYPFTNRICNFLHMHNLSYFARKYKRFTYWIDSIKDKILIKWEKINGIEIYDRNTVDYNKYNK